MTGQPSHDDRHDLVGDGEWTHAAVPPGCECPQCREWCIDLLIWIDDEQVECGTCGHVYRPGGSSPSCE